MDSLMFTSVSDPQPYSKLRRFWARIWSWRWFVVAAFFVAWGILVLFGREDLAGMLLRGAAVLALVVAMILFRLKPRFAKVVIALVELPFQIWQATSHWIFFVGAGMVGLCWAIAWIAGFGQVWPSFLDSVHYYGLWVGGIGLFGCVWKVY